LGSRREEGSEVVRVKESGLFKGESWELVGLEREAWALKRCPWERVRKYLEKKTRRGAPGRDREKMWGLYVVGAVRGKLGFSESYALLREPGVALLVGYGPGQAVPHLRTYQRFVQKIAKNVEAMNELFRALAEVMEEFDEVFGEGTSGDATVLRVIRPKGKAKRREESRKRAERRKRNSGTLVEGLRRKKRATKGEMRRREREKNWMAASDGTKTCDDGRTYSWYGIKALGMCESRTGMPLWVGFEEAREHETKGTAEMLAGVRFLEQRKYGMFDMAWDGEATYRLLLEEGMVAVIPIKHEPNRLKPASPLTVPAETVYDRERLNRVFNHVDKQYYEAVFAGSDWVHERVKYRCPCGRLRKAGALGREDLCPFFGAKCKAKFGKTPYSWWIPLKTNYRYYSYVPRETKKWRKQYSGRTSIEREFGHIDENWHFNDKQKEVRRTDSIAGLFLQGVLGLALLKLWKAEEAGSARRKTRQQAVG